jgi:hypothetical protein
MARLRTMTATMAVTTTSTAVTTTILARRLFLAPSNGMIETRPEGLIEMEPGRAATKAVVAGAS